MVEDTIKIQDAWNKEYDSGKYYGEEGIPFVEEIIDVLNKNKLINGKGLYVGCGNGRNYLPLVNSGLKLTGLDISSVAITHLLKLFPNNDLICCDFLAYNPDEEFDYLISIQIFQHGKEQDVKGYFNKVREILKKEGFFFLRVNSISTELNYKHELIEKNALGGFTIKYLDGPKKDLNVHFYTKEEILSHLEGFEIISPIQERKMFRKDGSSWTQWEGIFSLKEKAT